MQTKQAEAQPQAGTPTDKQEKTAENSVMALPPGGVPAGLELYLNPSHMNQLYKVAEMYALSDVIPKAFQQKKGNCFIALEMAGNMGISPIFLMQNMAIVHGKPTLEAKLVSAMVNASGRFADPLAYEIVGNDPGWNEAAKKPKDPTYKVRAYTVRRKDNKPVYGPWITWDMVMGEGWVQKEGSKWKTLPELMFMYRAASYFAKIHCTDITFGMQTTEEMQDVRPVIEVNPTRADRIRARAGKVLTGFEEEDEEGDSKDTPATATVSPADCDHPYEMLEDVEGVTCCRKCGGSLDVEEGAPTYKEQLEIREAEIREAGSSPQRNMFEDP